MAIDPTIMLQAAVTARLEKAGCKKEELEGKNLEQLLKFAEEKGIVTGFEVEHSNAPAATETQLQEKRRHQKVQVEFAKNMKAYGPAILEYLEAMKEFDAVQLAKTQADKKTLAGKKADKDALRDQLGTELAFASKRVAVARQNLLDIENGLKEYRDTALIEIIKQSAIAEKDKAPADRDNTQALTLYKEKLFGQTDEVQQGVVSEYERLRAEKPSEAKEELGLDTNIAAYGFQKGPLNKNEKEMKKRLALKKIVVGDKDAYKDAKKADPNFDPKKPSVTYLNEKHYKAAQRYCESKGIILPEYKPGLELTDDKMKVYRCNGRNCRNIRKPRRPR